MVGASTCGEAVTPAVLWIVGEPGAGKTTLARALIGDVVALNDSPKFTMGDVCAFGHYTGKPFDGADTLPPSQILPALAYWKRSGLWLWPLTIIDGDKLANRNAVREIASAGVRVRCVHLYASDAAERRAARSSVVQNRSWVKGRVTKARRFADMFGGWCFFAFNTSTATVADGVRKFLAET
jgi:hypothetical protein